MLIFSIFKQEFIIQMNIAFIFGGKYSNKK